MRFMAVAVFFCLCTVLPWTSAAQTPADAQKLARDIFEELIEINTTDSVGDNTAAAEDVRVLSPAPRKGNLVEAPGPVDFNGVAWLFEHHRPLVDAAFCLNEGRRPDQERPADRQRATGK